ncbi:MAG TPA: hypothetical protein PKO15_04615 [Fibrobacteria bacterium]|nr:hypothetical protein [Fibrobacteria bacterium]HOX51242.1 hypothetical protein [Fibrobacteria bacterium]
MYTATTTSHDSFEPDTADISIPWTTGKAVPLAVIAVMTLLSVILSALLDLGLYEAPLLPLVAIAIYLGLAYFVSRGSSLALVIGIVLYGLDTAWLVVAQVASFIGNGGNHLLFAAIFIHFSLLKALVARPSGN